MNPNWHLSGKNAEENKSLQRESGRIRTERDTLRSEVAFQKGKVAELEKALAEGSSGGVMGPRGSPSQQERKMGVLGSQVGGGSPTKKAKRELSLNVDTARAPS